MIDFLGKIKTFLKEEIMINLGLLQIMKNI